MVGAEPKTGNQDIHPIEGVFVRIKAGTPITSRTTNKGAQVIARSYMEYGGMIGDNSGVGTLERISNDKSRWVALGIGAKSLGAFDNDWEFVQGGYDPRTGTRRTATGDGPEPSVN